jgi:hypothetical protein
MTGQRAFQSLRGIYIHPPSVAFLRSKPPLCRLLQAIYSDPIIPSIFSGPLVSTSLHSPHTPTMSTTTTTNLRTNAPSAWDTPIIIIGAVFAVIAVILGLPGAILAIRNLRGHSSARKGIYISMLCKSRVWTRGRLTLLIRRR